jgi:hypothetical protein
LALREGEGGIHHLLSERDPRLALALEDHSGVCLASICKKLAMAKLDINESLLAPPDK